MPRAIPRFYETECSGDGRIAENLGVISRINSDQAARRHIRVLAVIIISCPSRRSGTENGRCAQRRDRRRTGHSDNIPTKLTRCQGKWSAHSRKPRNPRRVHGVGLSGRWSWSHVPSRISSQSRRRSFAFIPRCQRTGDVWKASGNGRRISYNGFRSRCRRPGGSPEQN
jgi:hypothetical protein